MGLHIGSSDTVIIYLAEKAYKLQLYAEPDVFDGIPLLSSQGYYLKDINDIYLTIKEE